MKPCKATLTAGLKFSEFGGEKNGEMFKINEFFEKSDIFIDNNG